MTNKIGLVLLAVTIVVTAAVAPRLHTEAEPAHAQTQLFAVDAVPGGGTIIDSCRSVTLNDSFQIDFTFFQAPAMFGPELDLLYNGTILRIDSVDATTTASLFLAKNGSTNVADFSDSIFPDSDGTFHAAVFDLDLTGPNGDGAVIRLNVTAIGSGTTALTISNPMMFEVGGSDIAGSFTFQDGEIRVDGTCPTPPPAIGGISEFLVDSGDTPARPADSSESLSPGGYAAIAVGAVGAALALAATAWYARRRWLR